MSFLRKVALITGGARGFGKGFGQEVLKNGGKVSVVDLLSDEGLATTEQLNKEFGPGSATFIKCDVSNDDQLSSAFEETKAKFGGLDIVVNNAGIAGVDGLDDPRWKKVLDVNLNAVVYGNILAKKHLGTKNGGPGGVVLNTASIAGITPVNLEPVYAAAKHGVVGLTRSVADDFRDNGIRVGCICPTFVATNILTDITALADQNASAAEVKRQAEAMGLVDLSEVVKALKYIVESKDTGLVLAITAAFGIEIKYPKKLKGKI